jgi:type II secretory pathway component PulF
MFGPPRISTGELAGLCRRLATSLEAGIDIRRVWATEAGRSGSSALRARLHRVRDAVARGDSLVEALAATGRFFPPLFVQLAEVGEKTGHLDEVFAQLADHYDNQVKLRRLFLGAIAWPAAELGIAVVVVGLLIWIVGMIGRSGDVRIDPLGLGLVGNHGLMIYAAAVAAVGLGLWGLVAAVRRGLAWVRPIQKAVLRVPVLGGCLETLALARLAWSLHLTLNTEIDVRRALELSLSGTHNARFTEQIGPIDAAIARGDTITEALAASGVFPAEFLAAVGVGEQTGKLVESMALLSRQYQDRARAALATLTMLAGLGVWLVVAALIILVIFRLAFVYIGIIKSFMP